VLAHGILETVRAAESGGRRLKVLNPSNILEDLSERWDDDEEAYRGFKAGVQQLSRRWDALLLAGGNQNAELERLFGEPVKTVHEKRAERLHESRFEKKLSVTSVGDISAGAGGSRSPRYSTTCPCTSAGATMVWRKPTVCPLVEAMGSLILACQSF
jgi:hypothetical protein